MDIILPSRTHHRHSLSLPSSPPSLIPSSSSSSPSPRNMTTARMITPSATEECDLSSAIPSAPTDLPTTSVPAPHHKADGTLTPRTEKTVEDLVNKMKTTPVLGIDFTSTRKPRRITTTKASQLMKVGTSQPLFRDIEDDSSATNLLEGSKCCGGGCCRISGEVSGVSRSAAPPFALPNNDAFKSLNLNLAPLRSRSRLSGIAELPECTVRIESLKATKRESTVFTHPPKFVQPHPPFDVYSARIEGARELTRPGAPKRTYHFDLDVTDYPEEQTGVDFRVGGAIGVTAPNDFDTVDAIFDLLRVPAEERDEPVTLHTTGGRWPTIWGEPEARSLETTRRELLTWTVDIQSTAPTKKLLRVLAEYAEDENEKTILLYLCSKQGQAAFCELRTGPHISLEQLLWAFPSSHPPLHHLLSTLQQLMPRFYSLSADPHFTRPSSSPQKRIIEIAVTIHETPENYRPGDRTGVGSGFFERQAKKFIAANESTSSSPTSSTSSSSSNLTDSFDSLSLTSPVDIRIPIFRGLMANPLARDFTADGPMLLIGAGVGIAPFRGFVQRRLQNANCVNKVWVLQGVRDSLLDELYSGEWGVSDTDIKKVVESRRGTGRYVQEEVKAQKELVWSVVNAVDGRVFVCGSSKGMGEGVERALVEVAMEMGRLDESQAVEFWKCKKDGGQYIAETW